MTDKFLWNNKAITTLSGAHNNTTTTINLNPGDGALFPSPSSGEHFAVTIQATDGTAEVCYCTSRSVDALTVTRGQEASLGAPVAQTYVGGEAVELRVTAGTLNEFSQVTVAETITGAKTHTGKVIIIDGVADQEPPSILQSKLFGVMSATGAGTVDAITATFSPVFAALTNGLTCFVRATGANTSTTPTFKPDSLIAKTIVRYGNTALVAGDISAAGHELILRYNSTNDNWELLNPALVPPASIASTMFVSGSVDQAAIGPAAVGQVELITTTASGSISVAINGNGTYALSGGTYSWWTAGGTSSNGDTMAWGGVNTAAGVIGVFNDYDSGNRSFYVDERFIQSSPPWDSFGLGEVCLFVYILLNRTTGEIEGTQISPEPIWAYHGPTIITPHGTDKAGNKYRRVQSFPYRLKEALADRAKMEEYKAALATPVYENKIIDQDYKNADMDIIPHPFGNITANQQVVILEPTGLLCDQLGMMHDAGENIRDDILLAKYVNITRTVIDAPRVPAGVLLVRASLKYE